MNNYIKIAVSISIIIGIIVVIKVIMDKIAADKAIADKIIADKLAADKAIYNGITEAKNALQLEIDTTYKHLLDFSSPFKTEAISTIKEDTMDIGLIINENRALGEYTFYLGYIAFTDITKKYRRIFQRVKLETIKTNLISINVQNIDTCAIKDILFPRSVLVGSGQQVQQVLDTNRVLLNADIPIALGIIAKLSDKNKVYFKIDGNNINVVLSNIQFKLKGVIYTNTALDNTKYGWYITNATLSSRKMLNNQLKLDKELDITQQLVNYMNNKFSISIPELRNLLIKNNSLDADKIDIDNRIINLTGITINGYYFTDNNVVTVFIKTLSMSDFETLFYKIDGIRETVYSGIKALALDIERFEDVDNSYNYCMITIVILAVLVYIYLQKRGL